MKIVKKILLIACLVLSVASPIEAFAAECSGFSHAASDTDANRTIQDKNVLGEALALCSGDPKSGFYRNGFCQTGPQDAGTHVACAVVTDEFLAFTAQKGNDLVTPRPEFNFPGLKAGDKWCLCASRWMEAMQAGVAPQLLLGATHEKMKDYADLEMLKKYDMPAEPEKDKSMSKAGAYLFSFTSIDGQPLPLMNYAGQVILVVNTASQCGFTEQYKDLQALYERYKDRGFVVIGVPCNQFGGQEPGSEATIKDFVQKQFGITFPLTMKADVSGDNTHPFFKWASDQDKGGFLQSSPKWNFHKFLVDRQGQLYGSFGSQVAPQSAEMTAAIEKLLAEKN